MTKEIDRYLYEAVRDYLNDTSDIYRQFHDAAKSEKMKEVYEDRIRDCSEVSAVLLGTFTPRRRHKRSRR